jgi:hypothetical protein
MIGKRLRASSWGRRVERLACTRIPNGNRMLQQARNLLMELDDPERQVCLLA